MSILCGGALRASALHLSRLHQSANCQDLAVVRDAIGRVIKVDIRELRERRRCRTRLTVRRTGEPDTRPADLRPDARS